MCCNGSVTLKTITVKREEKTKQVPQQKIIHTTAQNVSLYRQKAIKDIKCVKCGHIVMLVNIAGRERKQCTDCKAIQ